MRVYSPKVPPREQKSELLRQLVKQIDQSGAEVRLQLPSSLPAFTKRVAVALGAYYRKRGPGISVQRYEHILIVRKVGA